MTMKTFNVTRVIEAEAVDIPNHPDLVVVYFKWSDGKIPERHIMWRKEWEKIKRPKDLSAFKPAHVDIKHIVAMRGQRYHDKKYEKGYVYAASPRDLEVYRTHEQFPKNLPKWPVKWGETVPDGWSLVGQSWADNALVDIDGNVIPRPVRNFYLNSNYRIYDIEKDEKEGKIPDLIVCQKKPWGSIDHVPGNGPTIYLDVLIPDGRYSEFMSLDMWGKKDFIDQNTSLSKYKRAEPVREEEPAWESFGDDD